MLSIVFLHHKTEMDICPSVKIAYSNHFYVVIGAISVESPKEVRQPDEYSQQIYKETDDDIFFKIHRT